MSKELVDYGNVKKPHEYDFKTDKERIDFLADMVEKGSQDEVIYGFTRKLLNGQVPNKNYQSKVKSYDNLGEIKRLFEWCQDDDNITYRNHIMCRDSYQHAIRTLELGSADCDQVTVLLCSMLASIGYPVAFRIISSSPLKSYHHIYALVGMPKSNPSKWIPLDATEKQFAFGQQHQYAKKKDYKIHFDACET